MVIVFLGGVASGVFLVAVTLFILAGKHDIIIHRGSWPESGEEQ